jgi:hypothetical protein
MVDPEVRASMRKFQAPLVQHGADPRGSSVPLSHPRAIAADPRRYTVQRLGSVSGTRFETVLCDRAAGNEDFEHIVAARNLSAPPLQTSLKHFT